MRFGGQVALITGGAVGLGRAFARSLCGEGAAVVLADIDVAAAEATAAALRSEGHYIIAVECDVAEDAAVDLAVSRAIDEFGGVDVLINNAGLHLMQYDRPFGEQPRSDIRDLFAVNIMGIVNCTMACRATMLKRGGGVVLNISSTAGFSSTSPYGVSKLAVRGLTIALATELAVDRIRVNAVAPGLMATENAMKDLPRAIFERHVNERQLIRRLGTMEDVVAAMLYLCSNDAAFVTGETIKVSGGFALGL